MQKLAMKGSIKTWKFPISVYINSMTRCLMMKGVQNKILSISFILYPNNKSVFRTLSIASFIHLNRVISFARFEALICFMKYFKYLQLWKLLSNLNCNWYEHVSILRNSWVSSVLYLTTIMMISDGNNF